MNLNPELSEELRKRLCKLSIEIIINDKELNKFMKKLGFICNVTTKHCLVFTNGIHKIRVSKTTSDKARRLINIRAELRRLDYAV